MSTWLRRVVVLTFLIGSAAVVASSRDAATPASPPSAAQLGGLWVAKRRFGPDARGPLLVRRVAGSYVAEIVGRVVPIRSQPPEVSFELPNDQGAFRGRFDGTERIRGHWIRPATRLNWSRSASPVLLEADGPDRWRGVVAPAEDEFTLFLLARSRPDGSLDVVMRNPDRDLGTQLGAERLVRDGDNVVLMGRRTGQPERELARGTLQTDPESMSLYFANRGGNYDFVRAGDDSDFYPRGKQPAHYSYLPPPQLDDGWPTGTLEDADISRAGIEAFVQRLLEAPMDSLDAPQIHALLVARHGKLVLEEYFHGYHRHKLHDTRSAAKSLTSIVVGAAMQAGAPLSLQSRVYEVMNGGRMPDGLEPKKRAMTLENLLTMSPGWFCDDTNDAAPGNEENIANQEEEPDFYRYTLGVPMAFAPGERSIYCSASANVALGMVAKATGESVVDTFSRLVGEPMRIRRSSWGLDPAGNPYGGGSVNLLPRDFLKLGQLMLDDGVWDGRRILSRDFVAQASAKQYHLRNVYYGYFWWNEDYPYKDRMVRQFSARGAGGQTVVVVPELDLVVSTMAGNYVSRTQITYTGTLVPRFVLPAVREPGDDPNAPVVEREFKSPYGPSEDGSRVVKDGAGPAAH
ncbi:MAG TPA: serine hydrolase [Thermoanaerobaculia bacterium]|jgi:CubicO group peptidase (beta-lactamase class C family)|nr:serine hydrolase [Thermoanaerobaculia bacterium]